MADTDGSCHVSHTTSSPPVSCTVLGSTKDRSRYENHNMIPETIVKARRTRLTIAQKIEVGHVVQLGNLNHAVMRQFNISERTVRNIKRSLPSLRRHLTKSTTALGTKTLHPAHYPKLEAYLLDFLSFARPGKMPVRSFD